MFTQFKDYKRLIREENLSIIIDNDTSLLRQMELTAQEEIESYLRHHFETSTLFAGFELFSSSIAYPEGAFVAFPDPEDDLYSANEATAAGETPFTTPSKWTKTDTRHQYLLTIFIDATLYHAHSRINPRNIPEFRIERYRDAVDWLKKVAAGKVSPDFPVKADPVVEGLNIHYGTTKVDTNTY
jgi:hypothetical protein